MRDFAGIVLRQPGAQVVGDADIVMLGIETLEDVDIFHGRIVSAVETTIRPSGLPRPVFALRATTWQPSLRWGLPSRSWRSQLPRPVFALRATTRQPSLRWGLPSRSWRSQRRLVEPGGIEPPTSCMPCKRS